MRNLIGILVVVVVVIAILIFTGILDLTPAGEDALEQTQENVGSAVENAGETIKGDAN